MEYGETLAEARWGEVYINEIDMDTIANSADYVGTVCAHEAGHLFLPHGHSLDSINLMSDDENITPELIISDRELHFTELQKYLIRDEIPYPTGYNLAEVENSYFEYLLSLHEALDAPDDIDWDDILDVLL